MLLSHFDFELPPEQIAQSPLAQRDASRLLVLPRAGGLPPEVEHRTFADVLELLPERALLVLNEARVIPARFLGKRASGGKVEVLLIEPGTEGAWEALIRCGGSLQAGEELSLEGGQATLRVLGKLGGGRFEVAFADDEDALAAAERCGRMPLPPYMRRDADAQDRETYQTVYARVPGAIAAPTAGLHFTPELLGQLEERGVTVARVVLHVGLGTFLPVREERLEDHVMHHERYEVPAATQALLADPPGPVIACGTTVVRTLEAFAASGVARGSTDLFITPGYEFQTVQGLITNFHLPKSTLLMLVSAFAGRERVLAAYEEAVREGYRFYSYGDAMLIR